MKREGYHEAKRIPRLVGIGFRLFGGYLLQLLIDPPFVTKRVYQLAVAGAPEHILDRHNYARTASDGAFD